MAWGILETAQVPYLVLVPTGWHICAGNTLPERS